MMKKNGHKYYAKAQNLVRKMTEIYDKVLYKYDIVSGKWKLDSVT